MSVVLDILEKIEFINCDFSPDVKVFVNPTRTQMQIFSQRVHGIRALKDEKDGTIYAWAAFDATHEDMARHLGVSWSRQWDEDMDYPLSYYNYDLKKVPW